MQPNFRITALIFCLLFLLIPIAKADWVKQKSGTLAWLHSVYFHNANKGLAVGGNGTILTTKDGGVNWEKTKSPTTDTIREVYFQNEKIGWLLCERDFFKLKSGEQPSYLMRTTDGGSIWEKVVFTGADGAERVAKTFFSKDGYGWAVGEAGALFTMLDDRVTWKKQIPPTRFLLTNGAFIDDLTGWLVGGGGTILFTTDGGLSWNNAIVEGDKTKIHSIYFVNSRNGWAVGNGGKILVTNNGGKIWKRQATTVKSDLYDVKFVNQSEGYAVGKEGTILRTVNGGNIWQLVKNESKHPLEKIFLVGKDKGWAVGFGGTILSLSNKNQQRTLPKLR